MKHLFALLLTLSIGLLAEISTAAPARPNILVLLADDLGFADVGFTGGKDIKTPNLDKLAAAGARLDSHYVQPLCSPTRAALLTGRYPMRYGLQMGILRPYEQRGLPLEERLLPQALAEVGYSTALVGKWHLGQSARPYLPTQRGFEHQYGHYSGQIDYFKHDRQGGFDWHRDDKECRDEGYSTHLVAKEAVRLIQSYSHEKPFFLYVAFNAVHSPFQAPEQYTKAYASLPEPRRTYAGMLAALDEAVGQIYAALDQKGFRTNTVILFSSDNGGPAPGRITDNGPLRAGKGTVYEGGTRVCAFLNWEGHIKAGSRVSTPLHVTDWYPTFLKLAGASSKQKQPLDGQDIWPVLVQERTLPEREILLNTTLNAGALRVGDWKLVVKGANAAEEESGEDTPAPKKKRTRVSQAASEELFNLAQDIGEKHNLAAENPSKLKALRERYEAYARQAAKPTNEPQPSGFKPPRVWGEPDTPTN
jgi:arylsulfatase A-like enzyme